MESSRRRSLDHFVSWRLFRCEGGPTVAGDHAMTRWWACAAAGGGESRDLRQPYSEDNPLLQDHSRQSNTSLYSVQGYTDLDLQFILQSPRHVKHGSSCLPDDNHVPWPPSALA